MIFVDRTCGCRPGSNCNNNYMSKYIYFSMNNCEYHNSHLLCTYNYYSLCVMKKYFGMNGTIDKNYTNIYNLQLLSSPVNTTKYKNTSRQKISTNHKFQNSYNW